MPVSFKIREVGLVVHKFLAESKWYPSNKQSEAVRSSRWEKGQGVQVRIAALVLEFHSPVHEASSSSNWTIGVWLEDVKGSVYGIWTLVDFLVRQMMQDNIATNPTGDAAQEGFFFMVAKNDRIGARTTDRSLMAGMAQTVVSRRKGARYGARFCRDMAT